MVAMAISHKQLLQGVRSVTRGRGNSYFVPTVAAVVQLETNCSDRKNGSRLIWAFFILDCQNDLAIFLGSSPITVDLESMPHLIRFCILILR